jgi:two-component system LytT family response regulator
MSEIRAIIIEDEFLNRRLIKTLIAKISPSFNVVGEAKNVEEGLILIHTLKPDVVFLDIQMPDGSGFDLLRINGKCEFEVVFITGFDEFALQAFEFNAIDYILKPIDSEKLARALERVKARIDNSISNVASLKRIMKSYIGKDAAITKIPLHYNNSVVLLDLDELMYIKSDDGCTIFSTFDARLYKSSRKLADYEFIIQRFPNFIRINRGTFINSNAIKSYTKGARCSIVLKDDTAFEISRRRKSEILGALNWR